MIFKNRSLLGAVFFFASVILVPVSYSIQIKHYNQLSRDELHDIIQLRMEVFVVEQNCPYQDLDGLDKDAYLLLMYEQDKLVGTLRILKPGVSYPEVAIGRVVSSPSKRGKGLGHLMMKSAMEFIHENFESPSVRISAQSHLVKFYADWGFSPTGKEYLEDGIPHSQMFYPGDKNLITKEL